MAWESHEYTQAKRSYKKVESNRFINDWISILLGGGGASCKIRAKCDRSTKVSRSSNRLE